VFPRYRALCPGRRDDVLVAFSAQRSLRLCLSAAAVWSGLGTAACACYFATSTRPDQPSPFLLLGAIIGAFMLPA
jgi:hypothetical protein